jgi:hypothetical protein
MSLNQPFLSLDKSNKENCLLCDSSIANGVKQTNFTDKGWTTLKEQALLWSKIHIPSELPKFAFTQVFKKIESSSNAFGTAHASCRTDFRTKIQTFTNRYGIIDLEGECTEEASAESESQTTHSCKSQVDK